MDQSEIRTINHCLVRIKNDDHHDAVQELYFLLRGQVDFVTFKYTHNKLDSEDLAQDFWARIDTYACHYRGGNGYSYLRKCLNNFCLDWVRKRNVRTKEISMDIIEQFESYVDEETTVKQLAIQEIFCKAKEDMSEREKLVLTLMIYEDKSVREIAQEIKTSKSEVGRIRKSALAKLKDALIAAGWDDTD